MAKNKIAFLVLLGSIQDTNALIPEGDCSPRHHRVC